MNSGLRRFLNIGEPPRPADCIFVMAGRQARKIYGLDLWRRGFAPELILSVARYEWRRFYSLGLPSDGGLRSLVESTPPEMRHFFVRFFRTETEAIKIHKARFGTMTESRALCRLLRQSTDSGRNPSAWTGVPSTPGLCPSAAPVSRPAAALPDESIAAHERMLGEQPGFRLMVVSSLIHLRRVALAFRRTFGDCGVEFNFVAIPDEPTWPVPWDVWAEFSKFLFYSVFLQGRSKPRW